ncbi:MAG: flagellar motor protein MotB, partial [Betaproteobacteria bacterium]|nr:flagellar motor protein MotB [Betaproteobacteria bacterium]
FEALAQRIRELVEKAGIKDQVIITEKGIGVEIAFRGGLFFDSGLAEPRPEARKIVTDLIQEVSKEKDKFFYLVEGHTDGVPIRSKIYASNWELSSVRACSVLRIFEEAGIDRTHLKAVGYADTRKVVEEKSVDGVYDVRALDQNRRVVIKVLRQPDS